MSELWSLPLKAILSLDPIFFFILDIDFLKQNSLCFFFPLLLFLICGQIIKRTNKNSSSFKNNCKISCFIKHPERKKINHHDEHSVWWRYWKCLTFIKMITYTEHFPRTISFNPQNSTAIKLPQVVQEMVILPVQEHTLQACTLENTVFLFSYSRNFRTHHRAWR